MANVDYKKWAVYNYELAEEYLPENPFVLELAAGNCLHAFYLHKRIKKIVVSDISFNMLCASNIHFTKTVVADMTALPFKKEIFDAIFCSFDSINYLNTKKKLRLAFKQAAFSLKKNGIFEFDVSLEKNSRNIINLLNRSGIIKGIRYRQKSYYLEKSRLHKNILFFYENDDLILQEVHIQKIYPLSDYFYELDKAGFVVLKCYETFKKIDASEKDSERATFVARKIK